MSLLPPFPSPPLLFLSSLSLLCSIFSFATNRPITLYFMPRSMKNCCIFILLMCSWMSKWIMLVSAKPSWNTPCVWLYLCLCAVIRAHVYVDIHKDSLPSYLDELCLSRSFSPDKAIEALHTQRTRRVYFNPEPDFWMCMVRINAVHACGVRRAWS